MHRLLLVILLITSFTSQAQKIRFSDTSNKMIASKYQRNRVPSLLHNVRQYFDGDTIVNGKKYQKLNNLFNEKIWVREESDSGKVYQLMDSLEEIYMDYSWQDGDTIIYYSQYPRTHNAFNKVYAVDTTLIDGEVYKIFHLTGSYLSGVFLEGVGHISNFTPWEYYEPKCFITNGQKPAIKLFPDYNQGVCSDSALSITDNSQSIASITVYPQPAHNEVTIRLPYAITEAKLQIHNTLGKRVYEKTILNTSTINFDPTLSPGVYLYIISDNTRGANYTGRILFE